MKKNTILLPEAYKKCRCGKRLNKINRTGIIFNESSTSRDGIIYCCIQCNIEIRRSLGSSYFYYEDEYPATQPNNTKKS